MKRSTSWVFALIVLTLTSGLIPSAAAERRYQFVLEGGVTASKPRMNDPFDMFTYLKSFTGGAGIAWPISNAVEVQPEVIYVVKGFSYGDGFLTNGAGAVVGKIETLHVVEAIEVPVLLRWRFHAHGRLHPSLFGGPFVSFETAERLKVTRDLNQSESIDGLKNTDFGVAVGAGLGRDTGPGQLFLEGRYEAGLVDLGPYLGASAHSSTFAIVTGFRF